MVDAAKNAGYNITLEEYKQASEAYSKKVGDWKAIKSAFRVVKIARKVKKANR